MNDTKKGKRVEILSALKVESATYKEQRTSSGALIGNRLSDGSALYLFITPAGAKSWRFSYRYPKGGKNHVLCYGSWPDLSLSEARKAHARARLQLASGLNPAEEKKKDIEKARAAQDQQDRDKKNTFKTIAAEWYAEATNKRKAENRPYSESWERNTTRWITWANEAFGAKTLADIEASDVLTLIKRAAADAPASSEQCRQAIARIFNFGIANLKAPKGFNPALAIKGAVMIPRTVHHPRLEAKDLPKFLRDIDQHDIPENLKIALKLLLHCFPRNRELCDALWEEVSFDRALWTIGKGRAKSRRDHLVPLTPQTLAMFRRLKELAGDSVFVLPSPKLKNRPIGQNALNDALKSIGYGGDVFVPHSARSTAASIMLDAGWDEAVVDAQLAHRRQSATQRAYFRNEYMTQRTDLLGWWSKMLDSYATGGNVVPIGVKAA